MSEESDATAAGVGAIGSVASSVAQVSEAMRDAMTPEAQGAVDAFFEQIGIARGIALSVVGMHLGTFIGGCHDLRLPAEEMVDSLMHCALRGSFPFERMLRNANTPDNIEYLEASTEIVRAALDVLERQVKDGHDPAIAMRKYLTLLVAMVYEGSAKIEAQMVERRVDD